MTVRSDNVPDQEHATTLSAVFSAKRLQHFDFATSNVLLNVNNTKTPLASNFAYVDSERSVLVQDIDHFEKKPFKSIDPGQFCNRLCNARTESSPHDMLK